MGGRAKGQQESVMARHRVPTIPGVVERIRSGKLDKFSTNRRYETGDAITFYCAHSKTGIPLVDADGKPIAATGLVVEVLPDHGRDSYAPYLVKLMTLDEPTSGGSSSASGEP